MSRLPLDTSEGSSFLKVSVTLVCFQLDGTLPLSREKLNRSFKGDDRGCASPFPASILHKSIAGRYRPVSYPDGPITARYRFM